MHMHMHMHIHMHMTCHVHVHAHVHAHVHVHVHGVNYLDSYIHELMLVATGEHACVCWSSHPPGSSELGATTRE